MPFDPAQHTLSNHVDPVYTNLLLGGTVAAAVVLLFLSIMTWRSRKQGQPRF
jgi:hypothetical protein